MTVAELRAELAKMPQNLQVIMAADEEGNGYSAEIEVNNDSSQCVILWPGNFDEIDEVVDGYDYSEEE